MPSAVNDDANHEGLPNGTHKPVRHLSSANDLSQNDYIPSHPLGVKPLGNQYFFGGPNAKASIGTWTSLPDEIVMLVLEQFDKLEVLKLGHTCKFFFAFCHSEELWKALFLQYDPPAPHFPCQ